MSDKTLADLFAEEPADGTHLVVWDEDNPPYVIWRDDAEAKRRSDHPTDERWFSPYDDSPMMFAEILADVTDVGAVVPLDQTFLALTPDEG